MTLALYVLAAMLAWTRPHAQPKNAEDGAWLSSIADDIASVSLQEPPLFSSDASRARTALLLASVARYESNFAPWVDTGLCNDRLWRRGDGGGLTRRWGDCDGGHAFSLWQIHAGALGQTMIGDRRVAIREAITRLRVSLDAGKGLCWYTGENASGECPKAELRLRTAQVWAVGHPFKNFKNLEN